MRRTNAQLINHMMESSQYGALTQAFLISGIEAYCRKVDEMPVESFERTLISGEAWKGISKEIQGKITKHYARESKKQEPNDK